MNTFYKLKKKLAGVLYLHDITKAKVGGMGQRNLRMLEKMIGQAEYSNCTLVTTKWGCTTNSQHEEQREMKLREDKKFFGGMLDNAQHATMERFDPKTRARALEIITPYLRNKFTPQISQQMVDPQGPKLALGETEAGKVIADNLETLTQANQELERVQLAQEILSRKYDETLFSDFKQKRRMLRHKIRLQSSGRWIMRTAIVGGALTASVLTLGPGASASALALVPLFEKAVSGQRKAEKKEKVELKAQFVKESQNANKLKGIDADWLDDDKVQRLEDVESYSLKSYSLKGEGSDINLAKIVQHAEVVGIITSDGSEAVLDAAGLAMSESSDSEEAELSESDDEEEE